MENKEPDDDLFDRLNVSDTRLESNPAVSKLLWSQSHVLLPDFYPQQAPPGADGRPDGQSFPYLQRLDHPAGAAEGADERYVPPHHASLSGLDHRPTRKMKDRQRGWL